MISKRWLVECLTVVSVAKKRPGVLKEPSILLAYQCTLPFLRMCCMERAASFV